MILTRLKGFFSFKKKDLEVVKEEPEVPVIDVLPATKQDIIDLVEGGYRNDPLRANVNHLFKQKGFNYQIAKGQVVNNINTLYALSLLLGLPDEEVEGDIHN